MGDAGNWALPMISPGVWVGRRLSACFTMLNSDQSTLSGRALPRGAIVLIVRECLIPELCVSEMK